MTMRPFWMIARAPTSAASRTEPKARYTSKSEARDAARTLATQNGAPFVILEMVEIIDPGRDQMTERLF